DRQCGTKPAECFRRIEITGLDGADQEQLLAAADRRMYKQKNLHHELAVTPPQSNAARTVLLCPT
ncbi:MAG: hypothetical protein M3Y27_30575, partial [Acidobacteriota bacterium]|nr:hypothetical protein [Acidobacteriota bacterium]